LGTPHLVFSDSAASTSPTIGVGDAAFETAAANAGADAAVRTRIRALFDDPATRSGFVASVVGKEVGLD
jgi:hypothetical protein